MNVRSIADWITLIDIQTALSDTGDNVLELNTLYYEFYLHVRRLYVGEEE